MQKKEKKKIGLINGWMDGYNLDSNTATHLVHVDSTHIDVGRVWANTMFLSGK